MFQGYFFSILWYSHKHLPHLLAENILVLYCIKYCCVPLNLLSLESSNRIFYNFNVLFVFGQFGIYLFIGIKEKPKNALNIHDKEHAGRQTGLYFLYLP